MENHVTDGYSWGDSSSREWSRESNSVNLERPREDEAVCGHFGAIWVDVHNNEAISRGGRGLSQSDRANSHASPADCVDLWLCVSDVIKNVSAVV